MIETYIVTYEKSQHLVAIKGPEDELFTLAEEEGTAFMTVDRQLTEGVVTRDNVLMGKKAEYIRNVLAGLDTEEV